MSSSQAQKSDSSGPSKDGQPQGPPGGADQGESPQTPAATLCADSALPPQTSRALPSLPAMGTGMCMTSSLPAVPVSQTPAAGHFYGGPTGPPGFAPCFPSPWQWSGMYGQMYGPSAFGGPAQGPMQPPPVGASAFSSVLLVASRFPDRLLAWAYICSSLLPVHPLLAALYQDS